VHDDDGAHEDVEPAATLEHVALAAGVSRATASRVLTGSGPASDEARRKVVTAAERLGYAAHPVARALVTGGGTRLVVAVTAPTSAVLDDPYLARVVTAAARVADGHGLGVAVRWLPLADPAGGLDRLARDRTVGAVVLVNTTRRLLEVLPPALRGRAVSIGVGSDRVPSVDVDNAQGTARVVGHLLRSGRRRIAMITGPRWLPCGERAVAAYRTAVETAGLPERTVVGDFSAGGGAAGTAEVLRRWPDSDAVVALGDTAALGALEFLRAVGRQVPGDVAVAGFDDLPAARHSGPALTTATHPVESIAAAAANRATGREGTDGTSWFPSELVVRESA
jgi:DNA-binding LacI/PurR family transcriptional regulator